MLGKHSSLSRMELGCEWFCDAGCETWERVVNMNVSNMRMETSRIQVNAQTEQD